MDQYKVYSLEEFFPNFNKNEINEIAKDLHKMRTPDDDEKATAPDTGASRRRTPFTNLTSDILYIKDNIGELIDAVSGLLEEGVGAAAGGKVPASRKDYNVRLRELRKKNIQLSKENKQLQQENERLRNQ